jgi:GH24 family phage-related lysozyme (muramidase)
MSNEHLKTGAAGLKLIKDCEGFVPKVYLCPAGKPTIGYGHVVEKGETFTELTEAQASELLAKDLVRFEKAIHRANLPPLNQNQFDALVSWTYNVGSGPLNDSTAMKNLRAGKPELVPAGLAMWDKATVGGKLQALPGLTKRRKAEGDLWMKPV